MKTKYFYGYNIVAAGFVIQGVCIGSMFAFSVFFREFIAEFGWSRAVVSGASSLAFFLMGAAGILAGRLNDKIGPKDRYFFASKSERSSRQCRLQKYRSES